MVNDSFQNSSDLTGIIKFRCTDEKNCIIMPGYCVAGTVGHRILHGERRIQMGSRVVDIKMKVEYMSFSAHADAKGIMQLVRMVKPKNLMFVHGEAAKVCNHLYLGMLKQNSNFQNYKI